MRVCVNGIFMLTLRFICPQGFPMFRIRLRHTAINIQYWDGE